MTIANANLQAAITAMDAMTTTSAKTTALITSLKSLVLDEFDTRGDENYFQARRKAVVLFDDAIDNCSSIATSMDANIA